MRNYVIINGVNSLTIQGLAINNLPPITKPMIRTQREEIDGRDGDIVTELGYSAYDKQMEIGLWGNYDINDIIKYFTGEGTIVFSNEEDKYYNFKILDQIDYEKLLKFKTATITLHCQPFKYPLEEEPIEAEIITLTETGENITLEDTEEAPMKIDLKGNTSQEGTPTPDTPQDIHVVSGDNSINVVGKNLFKPTLQNNGTNIILNNVSSCSISNGEFSFTASGPDMYFGNVKNAGTEYSDERGIKIFRNDNDYISFNLSNTSLNRTYVTAYDSNNISLGFTNINSYRGTYQFPSGCDYITFRFGKADAISGTTYKTTIMVAYGNTIPTYEPYQSQTYPINLGVENYLPNNATTQTINGITYTINEDKSIKINGTASGRADIYLYGSNTDTGSYTYIPKGTYTMDTSNLLDGTMFLQFREKTAGVVYQTKQNNGLLTLLSQQDCYFYGIMLAVENGKTINNLTFYPQIEKGTKLNSYTPYGTTPIELCKIGNYQDYIYKDNGKWYVKKEVGKFYSNIATDWNSDGNHRYYRAIDNIVVPPNNDTVGQGFCNVGLVTANQTLQASTTPGLAIHPLSRLYISEVVYNNIPTTSIELYYAYITPTIIEITDSTLLSQLETLRTATSYDNQTNISQVSNDLPFELDVSVTFTTPMEINNIGNIYAKPILTIEGTGNIGVVLNDIQILEIDLTNNGKIAIDVTKLEAYNPDDDTLLNRLVTGDYMKLLINEGDNKITFTGEVSGATLTNYIRWI